MPSNSTPLADGLRVVAILEGAKGVLVLLTGFGLLSLIHKDIHLAAVQLVQHLHINPASHYPEIFLNLASRLTDIQLWTIALDAILYVIIRFVEAVGLWMQRQWTKWFGLLTGGISIPVELYDVIEGVTWAKVSVLVVNVIIVAYLLFVVIKPKKA
jgi:uncharacterized membrane protein (DUF2068 family)